MAWRLNKAFFRNDDNNSNNNNKAEKTLVLGAPLVAIGAQKCTTSPEPELPTLGLLDQCSPTELFQIDTIKAWNFPIKPYCNKSYIKIGFFVTEVWYIFLMYM